VLCEAKGHHGKSTELTFSFAFRLAIAFNTDISFLKRELSIEVRWWCPSQIFCNAFNAHRSSCAGLMPLQRRLVAVAKVDLVAGASQTVTLTATIDVLAEADPSGARVVTPGKHVTNTRLPLVLMFFTRLIVFELML
jgi:hypothetical protein